MTQSMYLSPLTGVRIAWGLTGSFHKEPEGGSEDDSPIKDLKTPRASYACELAEPLQKIVSEQLAVDDIAEEEEKKYILNATISLYSHMRSLSTIYCARELNFKENEVLRLEYLNFVKDNIDFGTELKDWLKALPTMAVGGITGITLASGLKTPDLFVWLAGVLCAVLGFMVYEWWIIYSCRRKQWTYIQLDFERTLYYKQYLRRMNRILENLYWDLNNLHRETFGDYYPFMSPATSHRDEIARFLVHMNEGVTPTFCDQVYKCISDRGILNGFFSVCKSAVCDNPLTPERWPLCETGDDDARNYCGIGRGTRERKAAQEREPGSPPAVS